MKPRFWLVSPIYWPWYVDLVIALISLGLFLYFGYLALLDFETFDKWGAVFSVFPFLYSANSALVKKNEDRKQRDVFERISGPFFANCQTEIEKHFPEATAQVSTLEEKVISTHFEDWKKYQNIQSIEYSLLETWLNNVGDLLGLAHGDKLLLKYLLITSSFPVHYPKLVSEIKDGDFQKEGSPHNIFIRKLHKFIDTEEPLTKIQLPNLTPKEIETTINIALNTNFAFINDLLKEKKTREKIDYLLNKCFENAYTNASSLNLTLQDDEARKLVFLYKYDERFSILKRVLKQAIRDYLAEKHNGGEVENLISEAHTKLESLIYPLPFSKALSDFDYCIEKLSPREKFAFIIYPDKFRNGEIGWSAEKFMTDKVLASAKLHQDEFNKKLVQEFPYLDKYKKKSLDANYYMFEFSRKNFVYHAAQEAIPEPIKRFLVREVLESDKAGDVVASQLIYLKQVINNLSISGLLFTENKSTQDIVRKKEKQIFQEAKKHQLVLGSIYDLAAMGNQIDTFILVLYKVIHGKVPKRRSGKKYQDTYRIAVTIVSNAKDLIDIFNSIRREQVEDLEGASA